MIHEELEQKIIASYEKVFDVKPLSEDGSVVSPKILASASLSLLLHRLQEEIFYDPQGMGYENKSILQITNLLNKPIVRVKNSVLREKPSILDRLAFLAIQSPRVSPQAIVFSEDGSVSLSSSVFDETFLSLVKEEIKKDRYKGKSSEEILSLLSYRGFSSEEEVEVLPSRYFTASQGIPFVPNEATEEIVGMAIAGKEGGEYAK